MIRSTHYDSGISDQYLTNFCYYIALLPSSVNTMQQHNIPLLEKGKKSKGNIIRMFQYQKHLDPENSSVFSLSLADCTYISCWWAQL